MPTSAARGREEGSRGAAAAPCRGECPPTRTRKRARSLTPSVTRLNALLYGRSIGSPLEPSSSSKLHDASPMTELDHSRFSSATSTLTARSAVPGARKPGLSHKPMDHRTRQSVEPGIRYVSAETFAREGSSDASHTRRVGPKTLTRGGGPARQPPLRPPSRCRVALRLTTWPRTAKTMVATTNQLPTIAATTPITIAIAIAMHATRTLV